MLKQNDKSLIYELDKLVDEGWLNRQTDKTRPLNIYCYSKEAMFKGNWSGLIKKSRGIVLDRKTGEIISKPFDKWFNFGERFCHPPKHGDYISWEKIDGSMLVVSPNHSVYGRVFTTKCSFENEYIDYALAQASLFDTMPADHTVITEVVIPEDKFARPVKHEPGLYLIGMTDMKDLCDIPVGMFYGTWRGFWPKMYRNSVDELIQQANEDKDTEGWVVRYSNGFRMKIKTAWYLKVFRAMSKLDEGLNQLIRAGYSIDRILYDMPEELHETIKEYYTDKVGKINTLIEEACNQFEALSRLKGNRKEFALQAKKSPISALLFRLLDNKPISEQVFDMVLG